MKVADRDRVAVEDVVKSVESAMPVIVSLKLKPGSTTANSNAFVTIKTPESAATYLYLARKAILRLAGARGKDAGDPRAHATPTPSAFRLLTDDPAFAPPEQYTTRIVQQLQQAIGTETDNLWAKPNESPRQSPRESPGAAASPDYHEQHHQQNLQQQHNNQQPRHNHNHNYQQQQHQHQHQHHHQQLQQQQQRHHHQTASASASPPDVASILRRHKNDDSSQYSSPSSSNNTSPSSSQHLQGINSPFNAARRAQRKIEEAAGTKNGGLSGSRDSLASLDSIGADVVLAPNGAAGGTVSFKSSVLPQGDAAKTQAELLTKKLEAELAIKNADMSQARTPTGYWVGGGLSKSMPESELKRITRPLRGTMSPLSESVDSTKARHSSASPAQSGLSGTSQTVSPSPTNSGPPSLSSSSSSVPLSASMNAGNRGELLVPSARAGGITPSPPGDGIRFPTGRTPPVGRRSMGARPAPAGAKSVAVIDHWNVKTLDELLAKLSLTKYSELFQEEEVDLATFLTLDDADLKEIGISKLGARRKLALAITELAQMRTMTASRGHFLTDVYALGDGAAAAARTSLTGPGGGSSAFARNSATAREDKTERGASLSSSLNGSLTGSFDSAGRRWSRTHQEKQRPGP